MTRGERVISFIERYCVVPDGVLVGKPVVLCEFQREFILAIYDNPSVTRTAILSIARKNGKTGLIAYILIAHLVGPEARQNSRIVSGALSREQAAEVYNLASRCIRLSPKLREITRTVESSKKIIGLPCSVEYQAISAEAKTAHGKSPVLAIIDEIGQVRGPKSDFIDAITTAQGAHEDPILIYISTQAADDSDLFSLLIDDALANKPPKTVCRVYAADKDADLMDETQWLAANPALGNFRTLSDMQEQAAKASRMPSFENTFRNLNLNQRVMGYSPFVSRGVWESNGGISDGNGLVWFGALDLSASKDLTSFTLVSKDQSGKIIVEPHFWTPEKGLEDRENIDKKPYKVWVKQGFLRTTPGATVDYDYVISDIVDIVGDRAVQAIAFDRWRIDIFKKSCERMGVELPLVEMGQGYKSMSPAIDALEAELLNDRVLHGMHPVLTMCAANAVITKDPAGNRKLDKHKATGRIDGMVTLAMAVCLLVSDVGENKNIISPWEDENFSLAG